MTQNGAKSAPRRPQEERKRVKKAQPNRKTKKAPNQADPKTVLVFNCQGGAGRTTTGMVIGSLLHLRKEKELALLPREVVSSIARRRSSNSTALGGEGPGLGLGRLGLLGRRPAG